MSILDRLRTIGDRLGIVEVVNTASPAVPAKVQTRTVTLADLTAEIRTEEVRALAHLPAELSLAFEKVFETAGVKAPPHGWTVERLAHVLRTDQFKGMDRETAQKTILGILASERVDVEDVVKDAVARDQALDAFEAFVQKKVKARMASREREVAELGSQILTLEQQRARLREEMTVDEEQWRQWHERKRAQERELAWAIGYLIDRPVVTVDEDSP